MREGSVDAVVFDMDGVLVDTEHVWDEVREAYVRERGGRYDAAAQQAMMGMSSTEWSRYMHDELGLEEAPERIDADVVERMLERYAVALPIVPGAVAAVHALADGGLPLAVASSSNRPLIDAVLDGMGAAAAFAATVSSEEVGRGKPAPDVYLEAARRLGIAPDRCAAVEDSTNGIRSAHAAGMKVIAFPNRRFEPAAEALSLATVEIDDLDRLVDAVAAL